MDVDRGVTAVGPDFIIIIVVDSPRESDATSTHARVSVANVRVAVRRISHGRARRQLTMRCPTVRPECTDK